MSRSAILAKLCMCFAVLTSVPAALAADSSTGGGSATATSAGTTESHEMAWGRHFDSHINSWAEGTVSSIDYDHNSFLVRGKKLPFATAHAQMRKEFNERMKTADASQRDKIIADVRKEWADRLQKARNATASEPEKVFNFNFAADGKVKDASDFKWLSMLRQRREMMKQQQSAQANQPDANAQVVGEIVIIDFYETPQNVSFDKSKSNEAAEGAMKSGEASHAQNVSNEKEESATHEQNESAAEEAAEHHGKSNLTFRDLKAGDKVMIGFDEASNQGYLVIRENQTGSSSTSQPSSAK
jgi:hypothetical protein